MTPTPNLTGQAARINSTTHSFFAPRSQRINGNSVATHNSGENITTEDTSNSSNSDNITNNPNFDPIEPEMSYISPHQADSTQGNRCRAVTVYDEFAVKHSNPTYVLIKMPVTDAEMCDFRKILEGFSTYLVNEATQSKKDIKYEPGTASGYFSSLYNALLKKGWMGLFYYSTMVPRDEHED